MVDKYFFVCLVFPFVGNAACPDPPKGKVADISLDYYFGLDDTLRSARFMENCNPRGVRDSCQKLCGPNHACLMGKCFCVDVKPHKKEEDDSAVATTTDKGFSKLFARLRVLEELLRRTSKTAKERQRARSGEDTSLESESEENNPRYIQLDGLAMRPTLRHHIAHFCPNLAIARSCIRQCLELGKPAFCGKDHVCYCGHKYGTPMDDVVASEEYYTQFQDLYERYFGPKHSNLNLIASTKSPIKTTITTTLPSTSVESSEASGSEASSQERSAEGSSNSKNDSKSEGNESKSEDKSNKSEDKDSKSGDKDSKSEEKDNTSENTEDKSENKDNKSEDKDNKSGDNNDTPKEEFPEATDTLVETTRTL